MKRILSLLICCALYVTCIAALSASAITPEEIQTQLDTLMEEKGFRVGDNSGYGPQGCHKFIAAVSKKVLGVGIPQTKSAYELQSNDNWTALGTETDLEKIVDLLETAQPGDIYRAQTHTAMIYSVNSDGITIYQNRSNSDKTAGIVKKSNITFKSIKDSTWAGLSLYRCNKVTADGEPASPAKPAEPAKPVTKPAEPAKPKVYATVKTTEAKDITTTGATLYGKVTKASDKPTELGMYIGTSKDSLKLLGRDNKGPSSTTTPSMWYKTAKNGYTLEPNTTYYYQAYAVVGGETFRGEIKSFKTLPSVRYYPKCASSYTGIVPGLNSIGVDSSFANRKKIAIANGIANYKGTAAQNTKLIDLLRAGKLIKP